MKSVFVGDKSVSDCVSIRPQLTNQRMICCCICKLQSETLPVVCGRFYIFHIIIIIFAVNELPFHRPSNKSTAQLHFGFVFSLRLPFNVQFTVPDSIVDSNFTIVFTIHLLGVPVMA